jgi:hypothetical protein
VFAADLAIYTRNRLFRVLGSTKRGQARPLVSFSSEDPLDPVVFRRTLVQYFTAVPQLLECLEADGSEPVSTNNLWYPLQTQDSSVASASSVASVAASVASVDLGAHYREVFPFAAVYALAHDEDQGQREFCFVNTGQWKRRLFFDSAASLRAAVLRDSPSAIHIGPFVSEGNETASLRFDVDLRDGAPWRSCCGDRGTCCSTCWPIAQFGQRVLLEHLRDVLGPRTRVAFFFSGSKGWHAWVWGLLHVVSGGADTPERRSTLARGGVLPDIPVGLMFAIVVNGVIGTSLPQFGSLVEDSLTSGCANTDLIRSTCARVPLVQ